MPNLVFFGGGRWQIELIRYALDSGHKVLVLDGNGEALASKITSPEYEFQKVDITSIRSTENVLRNRNIDGILCPANEKGVVVAARIAENIRVPGPGEGAARLSRNKYLAREALRAAGLPVPNFRGPLGISQLANYLPEFQYPAVLKPIDGAGSKYVRRVNDSMELRRYLKDFLHKEPQLEFILEEFSEGPEFSLEGIVQNGHLRVFAVCEKDRSATPYLYDTAVRIPSRLKDSDISKMIETARKITDCFEIQDSPIHFEFIQKVDGCFMAVDLAVRTSGFGLFEEMISWGLEQNTSQTILDLALGNSVAVVNREKSKFNPSELRFLISPNTGLLKKIDVKIPEVCKLDGRIEVEKFSKVGEVVTKTTSGAERLGFIRILAKSELIMKRIANQIEIEIEVA